MNERLREYLTYDPVTGNFTWRKKPRKGIQIGSVSGSIRPDGYRYITFNKKCYYAHRLAHLFMRGEWPEEEMDHVDGNRDNNAWDNLRPCQRSENHENKKASSLIGAHYDKTIGRWRSRITKQGHIFNLGIFLSPEEAHAAYLEAKKELHTFQPEPRYV